MTDDLKGKKALITGASGGLGLHFAKLLAAKGVAVTLAARRRDRLDQSCAEIASEGGIANAVELDVASAASVSAAFATSEIFDIVVNNAGISGAARALELSEDQWDAVFDVNLKGAFLVAQAAASAMKAARKGGSIINIASIAGMRVAGDLSAYAASKAGLIQLSKGLALEWARFGIRVNALCPGYIETDINRSFFATEAGEAMVKRIPQRRLGRPDDLDGVLLLLASDASRYMTGSVIVVDGGHMLSSL